MNTAWSYPEDVAAGEDRERSRRRTPLIAAAVSAALVCGGLLHFGLSSDAPNPYSGTQLLIALSSTGVGAWVARRRPDHPLGWTMVVAGLAAALVFASHPMAVQAMWLDAPEWVVRIVLLAAPSWVVSRGALLVVAPSVVPGMPTGLRRAVMWFGIAGTTAAFVSVNVIFLAQPLDAFGQPTPSGWLSQVARIGEAGSDVQWLASTAAVLGLLVTAMRGGAALRRQQRFFLLGAGVLAVPALVSSVGVVFPSLSLSHGALDRSEQVASTLLPIALLFAVVHDRMLDISVVVRRAVLYGVLTLASAAVYVSAVSVASLVFASDDTVVPLVGTGAVALAFQPLRAVTQRAVARRVYGRRDEPYQVLARLGRRLADVPGAEEALPALVRGIADGLRLPYVAVELDLEPGSPPYVAAETGTRPDACEAFPLVYAGEEIGRLWIARRTPSEPFAPREAALLVDLAQHAGVVAHDARLAADLRRSRLDLVVAREEERRRLRGDLHDGLGPTLASVSLGLEAAAARVDDTELASLLTDLNADLREAMDDIRRLVYGLRPPALDELGLVRAIESFVAGAGDGGLEIELRTDELPTLPAAVEVAAYRIALEAINNVRRHARAHRCVIDLSAADAALVVAVTDDGVGLGEHGAGVGIVSMRQRADDLGGWLRVNSTGRGTAVMARLPFPHALGAAAVPA